MLGRIFNFVTLTCVSGKWDWDKVETRTFLYDMLSKIQVERELLTKNGLGAKVLRISIIKKSLIKLIFQGTILSINIGNLTTLIYFSEEILQNLFGNLTNVHVFSLF
jgi:hypothetical protein